MTGKTATEICEENMLIDTIKQKLLRVDKEELIEVLAVLSAKLMNNGVSYGYQSEAECIEGIKAKHTINPIRDTFYISFNQHDSRLNNGGK